MKKKKPVGCIMGLSGILGMILILIILFAFKGQLKAYHDLIYIIYWIMAILFFSGVTISWWQHRKRSIEKAKKDFKRAGVDLKQYFFAGKYLSGHPKIDKPLERCSIAVKEDFLEIYIGTIYKGKIENEKVKNIVLEDETTIQKRVGLKRMLAIGLFAFAIKKKVKVELAYLIIEWNDGRFDHETVFEFEGKGSITSANELRNKLINRM